MTEKARPADRAGTPASRAIPVFFAVDRNYAPFLAPALVSLFDNAGSGSVFEINILTSGLPEEDRDRLASLVPAPSAVRFFDMTEKLRDFGVKLHIRDYYSAATYFRFFIADMFPEYDKCLYLDSDICILSDVSELYATELGDDLVAGVTADIVCGNVIFSLYTNLVLGVKSRDYFNAGILVMNLEAMRREDVEERLTALMKRRRLPVAQDQDYLNIVCRGRARLLDHSGNQTAFPDLPGDEVPNIVHFKMYYKPWHYTGIAFEDRFWKYMLRTSYYSEVRSMLDRYTQSQREEDEVRSESLLELACNEDDDWTVEEDGTLSDSLFEIYGEETDGRAVAEN